MNLSEFASEVNKVAEAPWDRLGGPKDLSCLQLLHEIPHERPGTRCGIFLCISSLAVTTISRAGVKTTSRGSES
jgi:hypothetical protein